jgi:hypothetical protein
MRWVFLMGICWLAGFAAADSAFCQEKPVVSKKGSPVFAQVGQSSGQDYQKDNPLLKTDMTKVSSFQGKMFETKEMKLKEFSWQGKDQPIVLNKMFTQNSALAGDKNGWQSKDAPSPKKSDLTTQQSNFAEKKASLGGADVALKMVSGFDGKPVDAKKAQGFTQMLSDGQKRYLGPESPESPSEMELIKEHLKKADSPEELKKNQLTTDEVQKLLQPQDGMTRPK